MRRLRTYETFGSFNWDDFCQTIKDLFMDLYDKEYTIELFPPEYVKSAVDDGILLFKINLITLQQHHMKK